MYRLFGVLCSAAACLIAACATVVPVRQGANAVEAVPVADTVQPKLSAQPGIDPAADDAVQQRRCDFMVDLPLEPGWFSNTGELQADGRIALALTVLGPTERCARIELVNITVSGEYGNDPGRSLNLYEHRAEQVRKFFASHGIAGERIEARAAPLKTGAACDASANCSKPQISVQIRGPAR